MWCRLVAEGDRVAAIGSWKVDGTQWDWVQMFRVENSKLVETWLSGIGFESNWAVGGPALTSRRSDPG